MLLRLTPAALACGMIGLLSVPPGAPRQPQDPAAKNDGFVLEAGEHEVRDMIDRSAKFLGRNYVYSEAEVASQPDAKVVLQNRLVLDAVGCEEVISQLAYTKGFVMLPLDEKRSLFEWVAAFGPKRGELATRARELAPEQVLARRNSYVIVQTLLPLRHLAANSASNMLRPFFAASGNNGTMITIGSCGSGVLLQGFAPQVAAAIDLISKADEPPPALEPSLTDWMERVDARLYALEPRGKDKDKDKDKEQAPK